MPDIIACTTAGVTALKKGADLGEAHAKLEKARDHHEKAEPLQPLLTHDAEHQRRETRCRAGNL